MLQTLGGLDLAIRMNSRAFHMIHPLLFWIIISYFDDMEILMRDGYKVLDKLL